MLLIDGHNLIGTATGFELGQEAEAREAVLRRIGAALGSRRERAVVVFDGQSPGAAQEKRWGGIRVVFSPRGRTADDEILRRLSAGNARAATVVTSDRGLERKARALGARVEACKAFWARIQPPASRSSAGHEERKPEPGPAEVEAWLGLFAKAAKGLSHKI